MANKTLYMFDFCDTLVDFQSANAYVNYVIDQKKLRRNIIDYLRIALNRFNLMPFLNRHHSGMSINKALLLYRLKGLSYYELDKYAHSFYKDKIKPHLLSKVLKVLNKAVQDGHDVALVSGGYDIYLKYFAKEYSVPTLICTTLKFNNKIFSGRIDGVDCMGTEKPKLVLQHYNTDMLDKVYNTVVGLSDSQSDKPFFELCTERIVVTPDCDIPEWAKKINANIFVRV